MIEAHYREHSSTLVKKLARRVGNPYNAQDVVQEAYTRALKYWGSFDQTREFEPWFRGILNTATRDFKADERLQGRHVDVTDDNLGDRGLVWPHDSDLLQAIQGDIAALPHPDRDIQHLYFNMEYTPKEIGHVVEDVTAVNIRKKIQRFKEEMRGKYE